jgi:hypothetical protein
VLEVAVMPTLHGLYIGVEGALDIGTIPDSRKAAEFRQLRSYSRHHPISYGGAAVGQLFLPLYTLEPLRPLFDSNGSRTI